jgi:hypothetical protein
LWGQSNDLSSATGFVTVHLSYLLRPPAKAAKRRKYAAFVQGLRAAGRHLE